ncbi:MAG: hypothetical protein A3G93_04425 [Nitrospinae bacterium RIFCSPLOWO2_12_FULL_45_22]|nr:MAG: hypothetical protein A3G93_04425 [Nitrospinae bacterium RIFCSPLOWO2_12_FULL_45_22]
MRNPTMQELINKLEGVKELYKDSSFRSVLPYLDLVIKYYERVISAKEQGKFLVGHTVMCPIELFYAMDIVPLHIEAYALYNNFFGDLKEYLELAAQVGFPPEICSAHRVTDAMVLAQAFPKPDFFVFSSQACDNTPKSGEGMAEMYGSPGYFLDRPYVYDDLSLAYYTEEYEGLIQFLEEQTGRKMDYDRLKEIVARSYRVTELCLELNELRKAVPEPFPCEGLFAQVAVMWLMAGTAEAVTFYEQMRDEVKERVDKGIGVLPEERYRLILPFVIPFWDMSIMDWMQEEHGAVIVADILNAWGHDPYWLKNPNKPVENLARKTFVHPACYQLHGPMEPFIESMVKSAQEYRVDGAVFFAHIGCRQACACIRAVKDELQDKLDLPVAVIDCDLVDKSFTSTEEVKGKLEEFFERMEEKKGIGVRN